MFCVYILQSQSTGKRYVGQTSNLERRLDAHNQELSRYTKGRGPWVLVYSETYNTRSEAIVREKFLKSGKGREIISNLTK